MHLREWPEVQEMLRQVVGHRHGRTSQSSGPSARRRLDQLNRVRDLLELAVPPGNRLERLRGNRVGQRSIRINEQYRVCFHWENGYADQVEIADYH